MNSSTWNENLREKLSINLIVTEDEKKNKNFGSKPILLALKKQIIVFVFGKNHEIIVQTLLKVSIGVILFDQQKNEEKTPFVKIWWTL